MKNFLEFLVEAFIDIHTMGFELIGGCIQRYRHWGLGWAIMDVFWGILSIVLALLLDALIIYGIYCLIRRISITLRTKEIKYYNVVGKVTDKEYREPYTTHMAIPIGKVTTIVPQHHSEEYIVSVEYRCMTKNFYSESLYNSCKVNDPINLVLIHKLGKNNEIIETTLELPE